VLEGLILLKRLFFARDLSEFFKQQLPDHHPGENQNTENWKPFWIPAFAGMTSL
jgi:hypothetical protein